MTEADDVAPSERIAIEQSCTRLVAAFAYLVDHRRYDEVVALFTPDCRFERPGLVATGHSELRDFLNGRPASVKTRHVVSLPYFERVGAREVIATTYTTLFQGEGADETVVTVPGVAGVADNFDIFRLTPDGWRIAERKVTLQMLRQA